MFRKTSKFISVIMAALMIAGIFAVSSFAATSEEVDTHLQFNEDGEFKIMQVTDLQDGYPMKVITKNHLKKAIETQNPDLIVLTGDNINTTAGKSATYAWAINEFMSIFENYGIPVAIVFGNHDAEGKNSRADQMKVYEKYDCFVGCAGEDMGNYTCGTYYVPLYSSTDADEMVFNLWMIDSGDYNRENDLGGYAALTKPQIEWYKNAEAALAEKNGTVVPSFVFQHIVVPEIFDALEVADEETGTCSNGDKYYKLPEGATGVLPEYPCPPSYNNGEFDAFYENGNVLGMFFGHDHLNTYVVDYKGVKLCNTPGTGFASYDGVNAGVRTITLNENDLSTFETEVVTYLELFEGDEMGLALFDLVSDSTDTLTKISGFFRYLMALVKSFIPV